ncbi:MAG: V-type ATP synthase subunit F [Anaerolineae bacterium]
MKIVVIGNPDCVLGFSLAGISGHIVHNPDDLALALIETLSDKEIGLLLVSSDVALWARDRIDLLKVNSIKPLVVEVPGESKQTSYPSLKEFVQRSVGISLGGK